MLFLTPYSVDHLYQYWLNILSSIWSLFWLLFRLCERSKAHPYRICLPFNLRFWLLYVENELLGSWIVSIRQKLGFLALVIIFGCCLSVSLTEILYENSLVSSTEFERLMQGFVWYRSSNYNSNKMCGWCDSIVIFIFLTLLLSIQIKLICCPT